MKPLRWPRPPFGLNPASCPLARAAVTFALVAASASCTGVLGAGGDVQGERGAGPGGARTSNEEAGATPLRRLTRFQYTNTVRDLLGDTTRPGDKFQASTDHLSESGFTSGGGITGLEADMYEATARALAERAVQNLPTSKILPCQPSAGEDACAEKFIREFGKKAYRRPLAEDEVEELKQLYAWARSPEKSTNERFEDKPAYDFNEGIRLVLSAMLQASSFLYRPEFGSGGSGDAERPLTQYEVASRLSYFLWDSMPDDALFDAADRGELETDAEVESQARRLIADARAKDAVKRFAAGWLTFEYGGDIEKDKGTFPEFTPEMRESMKAETDAFVLDVVFGGDGRFDTLLTADYTFLDANLAKVYGVSAPSGSGLVKTKLDPALGRSGILTQPQFLARFSSPGSTSPTRRGKMIREQLIACGEVPPPPKDLNPAAPTSSPTESIREQTNMHAQGTCAGCHKLMDPIGFGFEGFDALGKVQSKDGGKPVDTSGELSSIDNGGTFVGVQQLAKKLAASRDTKECFTKQMFRFAVGRKETDDKASVEAAYSSFEAAGYDIRELMVAVAKTRGFRFRKAASAEVSQ